MKVLLTGATGFLGSHIAEQLAQDGHQVRCLVRPAADKTFLQRLTGIEFCHGDVTDETSLQAAVTGVDAVIHAAGLVKARRFTDFNTVNADGTLKLLNATFQHNPSLQRFILVSSLAAIGPSLTGQPLTENSAQTPHPVTFYGHSKLAAERHVLAFANKLPVIIIRPPLIYGPRDKECLAFFRAVKYKIFPFFGSSQNTASVIYATDAAHAFCQALQAAVPSGSAYFIEDGIVRTNYDMINQLAQAIHAQLWLQPVLPAGLLKAIAFTAELYGKWTRSAVMLTRDKLNELMQPHWVCDSAKAQKELNWRAQTDWAKGVRLTYEWYKKENWL